MAEHRLIDFTIMRAARPATRSGFPHVHLVDGITLDGDVVRLYVDGSRDLYNDLTDGFVNAATVKAVEAAWGNGEKEIYIGKVDTAAFQTYAEARAAVEAAGVKGYFWTIDSRADAVVAAFGVANELARTVFIGQSASADALTTGFPAALSTIAEFERTGLVWHDTGGEFYDTALVGAAGGPSPDSFSPQWMQRLSRVAAYATALSDTQATFALGNNFNLLQPFENQTEFFSAKGLNIAGRALYEIVTEDWFVQRCREDIASTIIDITTNQKAKFPLDAEGQGIINGIIRSRFETGEGKHFKAGQIFFEPYTLTTDNIDAGILVAWRAYITLLSGARTFSIPIAFTREDVLLEAI